MNQFLVHIRYTLLAKFLQKIKIKIKNKSLLYPMMPFLATFLVTIKDSPKDQTLYKVNHMTLSLWFSQSKNLVFIACPGIQTGSLLQLSYKGKVTWFSLYKVWSFRGYFIVTKHLQWHFALLECRQHGGQSCLSGGHWWPTWELGCRQVLCLVRKSDRPGTRTVGYNSEQNIFYILFAA